MTFWQKPCFYGPHPIETIGLDRIDSTKGYTMDNLVSCCETCNRAKRHMSLAEFREWKNSLYSF